MRTALHLVVSLVIGLSLLMPLAALYEAARLPVYHSWGLTHGSFTTAVPALVAASFVALGLIRWFGKVEDIVPRLIACLSVLVLVTVLFWVDQRAQYSMSALHLAVYTALFALFVLLCFRAQRPLLVPLFLLVPILVDPVFGLLITRAFDSVGMQILGHDLLHKILPAIVATVPAAVLPRLLRSREA